MSSNEDTPRTLREVGIYLHQLMEHVKELEKEVDDIKKGQSKLLIMFFTSVIAPITVAWILSRSR